MKNTQQNTPNITQGQESNLLKDNSIIKGVMKNTQQNTPNITQGQESNLLKDNSIIKGVMKNTQQNTPNITQGNNDSISIALNEDKTLNFTYNEKMTVYKYKKNCIDRVKKLLNLEHKDALAYINEKIGKIKKPKAQPKPRRTVQTHEPPASPIFPLLEAMKIQLDTIADKQTSLEHVVEELALKQNSNNSILKKVENIDRKLTSIDSRLFEVEELSTKQFSCLGVVENFFNNLDEDKINEENQQLKKDVKEMSNNFNNLVELLRTDSIVSMHIEKAECIEKEPTKEDEDPMEEEPIQEEEPMQEEEPVEEPVEEEEESIQEKEEEEVEEAPIGSSGDVQHDKLIQDESIIRKCKELTEQRVDVAIIIDHLGVENIVCTDGITIFNLKEEEVGELEVWKAREDDGIPRHFKDKNEENIMLPDKNLIIEFVLNEDLMNKTDEDGDLYLKKTTSFNNKTQIKENKHIIGRDDNQIKFRGYHYNKSTQSIELIKKNHIKNLGYVGWFDGKSSFIFDESHN